MRQRVPADANNFWEKRMKNEKKRFAVCGRFSRNKWFATRKEARQYLRKNEMKYGWGDVYIAERINGKMVVG